MSRLRRNKRAPGPAPTAGERLVTEDFPVDAAGRRVPDYVDHSYDEPERPAWAEDLDEDIIDDEMLAEEVFGTGTVDVAEVLARFEAGPASSEPVARSGMFDMSRLDAAVGLARESAAADEVAEVDPNKMSKEQRKAYRDALGDELSLYEHLLAIKPREKYVFRSDYIKIDGSGAVACVLAFFHRDEATDEFGPFWGVNRIPERMPEGVRAILIDSVHRHTDKWIDDAERKSEKLAKLDEREQSSGGTMRSKRKMAKSADDLFETITELQDGAAYLSVHMRMVLHAPSLEKLDLAIERLARQYIDPMPSVHVEPYHGEQRQELSTLLESNDDKRGNGFDFTSTEFAGAYSLVTNGLSDPSGEFVGRMSGDYNNSAILFEVDRWTKRVVCADETLNVHLGRARVVDMWASKISQAALLNNRKVVHLVLNGADLDKLGPPMDSITTRLDMTRGEINMFELFGERRDQLSLYDIQLTKLVLMAEQSLEDDDPDSIGIIRNELRAVLTQFYIDQRMWARSAESNLDKLRLVGLPHDQVPRLMHFVPYLDTLYKSHLAQGNQDALSQQAIKTLQGVFTRMLESSADLFNRPTAEALDRVHDARRIIYDFSGLTARGQGLAMAQLINVVGFAVNSLGTGDTLIVHGADRITDPAVQNYLTRHFDRLLDEVGGRLALCYDKPDVMLATREFNYFERADYTVLGPMASETVENYEKIMRTAIPADLKRMLAMRGYAISYLRRGASNVVFDTRLSLGLSALREADMALAGEEAAAVVADVRRNQAAADNSQVAALSREQAAEAEKYKQALRARPVETTDDRDAGKDRPAGASASRSRTSSVR